MVGNVECRWASDQKLVSKATIGYPILSICLGFASESDIN